MGSLTNKVALVAGASQGIGEGVARALHQGGAKVALLARNEARLRAVTDSLGSNAFAAVGDVTDGASLAHVITASEEALGPIDILVNNAGGLRSSTGGPFRPFEQVPDQDWIHTWELNVLSAVRASRLLAPGMAMRGWGRIINISSESGSQPDPVAIEYASAKGALNVFSKGLSKAYAERGVLVTVVSPAYVDTPILREILSQQEGAENVGSDDLARHYLATFRPNIGVGRPCTPEDVAAAVLFLASDEAGFVTGIELRVDGGSVATL